MPRGFHANHARGSEHYAWNRGPMVSKDGYSKVRVGRGHPLADKNGYAYEHLVVWVSAGRARPAKGECLKFRNDNRRDCRIENLYVVSRADHNRLKNARQLRDDGNRFMSRVATRVIRSGAAVRTVRLADGGADRD